MPLPGGASDKFGNRYELRWTVAQMFRILDGEALSIRTEPPGHDGVEFEVVTSTATEYHQAKRSTSSGKWTLSALKEVLQNAQQKVSHTATQFVFASSSDARELAELAERAESAANFGEYQAEFLSSKAAGNSIQELESIWNCSTEMAYDYLTQLRVRTIDEIGIKDWNLEKAGRRFLVEHPESVLDALADLAMESVHKKIDRAHIEQFLLSRGYQQRRITNARDCVHVLAEVTDRYLWPLESRLILGKVLNRQVTSEIIHQLEHNRVATEAVLVATAGLGKSSCLVELIRHLKTVDVPVLAFRLDRLSEIRSAKELTSALELEEAPALVLQAAARARGSAVLLIDQLDALSAMSGRNPMLRDIIEQLLAVVRIAATNSCIHIVIACREYDLENDALLRNLLTKSVTTFRLDQLSDLELESVLDEAGVGSRLLTAGQRSVLRTPQNLKMYLELTNRASFTSPMDLLHLYWDEKKREVESFSHTGDGHWHPIVQKLCEEMNKRQQLSVPKASLDTSCKTCLDRMVSVGFLAHDTKRIAFSHESLFDYSFARAFAADSDRTLLVELEQTEQHLFRRAQVRQVLWYLRESDPDRYLRELKAFFSTDIIRAHIKDAVLVQLGTQPNPQEEEWKVITPWILASFSQAGDGALSTMMRERILKSPIWLPLLIQLGVLQGWLYGSDEAQRNVALDTLRHHQRQYPNEVIALLKPHLTATEPWRERIRWIFAYADVAASRMFFESFLHLIDAGTFDDNGHCTIRIERFAHSVVKADPAWLAELVACWLLKRKREYLRPGTTSFVDWREMFGHGDFSRELMTAAKSAPEAVLDNLLEPILQIAKEAASRKYLDLPRQDLVWGYLIRNSSLFADSLLEATASALEEVAADASRAKVLTEELGRHQTHTSNFLLMRLYAAAPSIYGVEAAHLLVSEPWRLTCGYGANPYWTTKELLSAIVPVLCENDRFRLEDVILRFRPPHEKDKDLQRYWGHATYQLLSAFPGTSLSDKGRKRFDELERKFGSPDPEPVEVKMARVSSPIDERSAALMTDEQWLAAMDKYSQDWGTHHGPIEKGGAVELSRVLQTCAQADPDRFAALAMRIPETANPHYLGAVLAGIRETDTPDDIKLHLCERAFNHWSKDLGSAVADTIKTLRVQTEESLKLLAVLVTEHPDPAEESWEKTARSGGKYNGGDIFGAGLNCTRGRAVLALAEILTLQANLLPKLLPVIKAATQDPSVAVRSCVAKVLLRLLLLDRSKGVSLFVAMTTDADERLLGTQYAEKFVQHTIRRDLQAVAPLIRRMLESKDASTAQAGARMASLAALEDREQKSRWSRRYADLLAWQLVRLALRTAPCRIGVAEVAAHNLSTLDCRHWCERHLVILFNDEDVEVQKKAAECFGSLESNQLEEFSELLEAFRKSRAFESEPSSLLRLLENNTRQLPHITVSIGRTFLDRLAEEARDMRTHTFVDGEIVTKLIFRGYHQYMDDSDWAPQFLDLIDELCVARLYGTEQAFQEFER